MQSRGSLSSVAATRQRPSRSRADRCGFTLIELSVVIAVLAMLMALLLPAVQSARESSRRIECQHRQRQLALAVQEHIDAYRTFPNSQWFGSPTPLLPFLEQQGVYNSLFPKGTPQHGPPVDPAVVVFVCPSDPEALIAEGNINYLFNGGTRIFGAVPDGIARFAVDVDDALRPRDVTDGMSNTALLAERLFSINGEQYREIMSQGPPDRDDPRFTWYLPRRIASTPDEAEFVDACRNERVGVLGPINGYSAPFGPMAPPYSHVLPPNAVGCYNAVAGQNLRVIGDYHGVTATSLHPGGVNLSYCDGHGSFVSDSIDLAAWRAVGSRNGHEVTTSF